MKRIPHYVFSKSLLSMGAMLIFIQQIPAIKDVYYEQIRFYLYVVFGLLSIMSIIKVLRQQYRSRLINIYAVCVIMLCFEFLFLFILNKNIVFGDLLETIVPFGIIVSSYAICFSKGVMERIAKIYVLAIIAISLIQIFYYAGGFRLYEQYALSDKNILGSFVATSAGIAFYYALIYIDATRKLNSFIWISVFGLLAAILVTIRSRAAFGSLVIAVGLMALKSRRRLRKLMIAVAFITIVSIIFSGVLQIALNTVRESVVLGYEFRDVDSLSGGRLGVYAEALELVVKKPLFGELSQREQSARIPHNYLLNKAKRYGFLGGGIFFILYGTMVIFIIRSIKTIRDISFDNLAIFLLVIPFLISLLEYQHPFGPGTSQVFTYLNLGYYMIKANKVERRTHVAGFGEKYFQATGDNILARAERTALHFQNTTGYGSK